MIKQVTDASFEQDVVQASRQQPVLVDFWAPWCGPCKAVAPVLEELASSHAGKISIVKVNVDDNHGAAAKFGIRSVPTLMLFKDGGIFTTKVGALSRAQLTDWLARQV